MKSALKKFVSKRAIVVLLLAVLLLSAFNTYLIFAGIQSANRTNVVNYDYVLSKDGGNYQLKNMLTGYVAQQPQSASLAPSTQPWQRANLSTSTPEHTSSLKTSR